jgi:hypothetical protein
MYKKKQAPKDGDSQRPVSQYQFPEWEYSG